MPAIARVLWRADACGDGMDNASAFYFKLF
jgi:hypothetical protein